MLSRLLNFMLLATLAIVILRAWLKPEQRKALHRVFVLVACAWIVSALLLTALALYGRVGR